MLVAGLSYCQSSHTYPSRRKSTMRFQLTTGFFALLAARAIAAADCTLDQTGADDAPAFLAAATDCDTITIPADTTLNISTRLNMTGLSNTHIVSARFFCTSQVDVRDSNISAGLARHHCFQPRHPILERRTSIYRCCSFIQLTDFGQNGFYFDFQDSITAWLLGGTNVTLSGGGTLDGKGQVLPSRLI